MKTQGLTLIELMVALAIAAALMAATLTATVNLSRSEAAAKATAEPVPWREQLRELLAIDVLHATRAHHTIEGLELETRASLERETLRLRHVPARVRYAVWVVGDSRWLVREQAVGDGSLLREWVCRGVDRIEMAGQRDGGGGFGAWSAVPRAVVVRVWLTRAGAEPVKYSFRTR